MKKTQSQGDVRILWLPVVAWSPIILLRVIFDLANRVWPSFFVSNDVLGGVEIVIFFPIYFLYSRYLMRHPRKKARGKEERPGQRKQGED
ncbi:MAG TPA: hypothetical protein VGM51_12920 [Armatimonadota bacterium]|jgi:hypothetical protein